ncbi:MAG: hypothetical protein IJ597_04610 [Synergistaceae bacterium]|nr:hypothetical protein [Synergistaceae bacterium]
MKNKNKNKKLAAAFIVIAAGSVFYGATKSEARGIDDFGIQITFGHHRGYDEPPPPPPPPPPHHHYHAHMPPPPPPPPPHHHFHDHRGPEFWDRGPGPRGSRGPRGHMPPPPRR